VGKTNSFQALSIHIKMPRICRVGEKVPVTIRIKNHADAPYPTKEDEYLIVDVWSEMIKHQPGRGYPTFNSRFSEPFKLESHEFKEIKFDFRLMEPSQYRITAKLNLIEIIEVRGNPQWKKQNPGAISGKHGRIGDERWISLGGGGVRVKVLDMKEISKMKSCMSCYDLLLLLGSAGAIIAAIVGIVSLILQLK